jgi:hypothetical protein
MFVFPHFLSLGINLPRSFNNGGVIEKSLCHGHNLKLCQRLSPFFNCLDLGVKKVIGLINAAEKNNNAHIIQLKLQICGAARNCQFPILTTSKFNKILKSCGGTRAAAENQIHASIKAAPTCLQKRFLARGSQAFQNLKNFILLSLPLDKRQQYSYGRY